jgi:tetratricopeptide (TPR) repeat protein
MVMRREDEAKFTLSKVQRAAREKNLEKRVALLEELEKDFVKSHDTDGIGYCELELATAEAEKKEYVQAVERLTDALKLIVSDNIRGELMYNRGCLYNFIGMYDLARKDTLNSRKYLPPYFSILVDANLQVIGVPGEKLGLIKLNSDDIRRIK